MRAVAGNSATGAARTAAAAATAVAAAGGGRRKAVAGPSEAESTSAVVVAVKNVAAAVVAEVVVVTVATAATAAAAGDGAAEWCAKAWETIAVRAERDGPRSSTATAVGGAAQHRPQRAATNGRVAPGYRRSSGGLVTDTRLCLPSLSDTSSDSPGRVSEKQESCE